MNETDEYNTTELHRATRRGNELQVEWLINGGADINAKDNDDSTPLHGAVIRGTPKIVEMLIENGANVNAQDKQQKTPLHVVAANGNSDRHYANAELLLNNGANVNLRNAEDKTPLDLANDEKSKFMIVLFFEFISLNQLFSIFPFVVKKLLESKTTII